MVWKVAFKLNLDQLWEKWHLQPWDSKERSTCSKFREIKELVKTCLKSEIKKDAFEDHDAQYLYQWLRTGALYV